jgi:hypothetical protein
MANVVTAVRRQFALLALAVAVLAGEAPAQESFRVTYNIDRSTPGRTKVTGQVFNDARADALDVYVTAEAVDGAGKVVARGISFVSPSIRQGGNASFEATVPAPPNATSFRVRVSNFRFGLGLQSP